MSERYIALMSNPQLTASSGALMRAAEDGRLGELVGPSSAVHDELCALGERYRRRLHVAVSGRPGTGRDTLARALRARLPVTAIGPGETDGPRPGGAQSDADLWIHLLTGPPRRADLDIAAALPADRTITVLGKTDIHADPDVAAAIAAECGARLATTVWPVSALLACAAIDDDEYAFLGHLVAQGAEMPSMAGQFLAGEGTADGERRMRAGLLRRIDRHGLDLALGLIAAGDPAAADAATLTATLRAISGIDALRVPIGERMGHVRRRRAAELRESVELLAARGRDRDAIEQLLQDGAA